MTTKVLTLVANELNDLFFKAKDPNRIDMSALPDIEHQKDALIKVSKLLQPEDQLTEKTFEVLQELLADQRDEFSEEQWENLILLGLVKKDDETEQEEDRVSELLDKIRDEDITFVELRDLAKANPEFKSIRGELSKYKTRGDMRKALLKCLGEPEAEPKKEPEKKPAPGLKKETVKAAQTAYNRIDSICEVIKSGKAKTMADLIEMANVLYVKNGGKDNVKESQTVARQVVTALKHFDINTPES